MALSRHKSNKLRILQPIFLQLQSLQGVYDSLKEISKWAKPLSKKLEIHVEIFELRKVQALVQVIQVWL